MKCEKLRRGLGNGRRAPLPTDGGDEAKIKAIVERCSNRGSVDEVVSEKGYEDNIEAVCKLCMRVELSDLVQSKMVELERLLVAATSPEAKGSREIVDATFQLGSRSLSRLPTYIAVVDRCMLLHKLLGQAKDEVEKVKQERERLAPAPTALSLSSSLPSLSTMPKGVH